MAMQNKESELEEIVLLDASMIHVEREKYQKESQEIQFYIKNLSSDILTSSERQRMKELELLAKKKQVLNQREESKKELKDEEVLKGMNINSSNARKNSYLYYLVEERDSILNEKKSLRSQLARLTQQDEEPSYGSRPNLLRREDGVKMNLNLIKPPTQDELYQAKLEKVKSHFEVVGNIDRIRQGASNLRNTDKQFLKSLNDVLSELKADYFTTGKPQPTSVGRSKDDTESESDVRDSIDELRDSKYTSMGKTRNSSFTKKNSSKSNLPKYEKLPFDPGMDLGLGPTDNFTQKKIQLMNMEKALRLDERLEEMNFHRKKLDIEAAQAATQMKVQDFLLKNYQDLMHEKNILRKEMVGEMESIRRDRNEVRKQMLEVRGARAELEADKKKSYMDRRARELETTRKEMVNIMSNYLDYKGSLSSSGYAAEASPMSPEININHLSDSRKNLTSR